MPFTIPTGRKVVLAGTPVIEEFTVEGSLVKPGRLVEKGTAATQVKGLTGPTAKPAGWVGWDNEGAHPGVSPATRDTAYAEGKKAPIWYGPGVIGVAKIASGQNLAKDTPLVPAANGELQAAATESATATSGSSHVTTTLTGSFPPGGMIVAVLKQNCDASSAAQDAVIESLI